VPGALVPLVDQSGFVQHLQVPGRLAVMSRWLAISPTDQASTG
jgi:hypothetical protein